MSTNFIAPDGAQADMVLEGLEHIVGFTTTSQLWAPERTVSIRLPLVNNLLPRVKERAEQVQAAPSF